MENFEQNNSIGKYLKSIRKEKKITLEQISKITKIKTRFLTDIENDVFDNFGGIGYAKVNIISFTRAIGANEQKILDLFKTSFGVEIKRIISDKSIQPKKLIIPTNLFSFLLLLIVIAVLTFFVIRLYKNDVISWPPFKKIDMKTKVKPSIVKPDTTSKLEKIHKSMEESKETEISLNKKALEDTIDYLDEMIFKDKESPFNYDD